MNQSAVPADSGLLHLTVMLETNSYFGCHGPACKPSISYLIRVTVLVALKRNREHSLGARAL